LAALRAIKDTMIEFVITIVCAAHIHAAECPLPNGFHTHAKAASHIDCVHQAKAVIASMGYNPKDAKIECMEK